jgi:hypothetical protein
MRTKFEGSPGMYRGRSRENMVFFFFFAPLFLFFFFSFLRMDVMIGVAVRD